MRFKKSRFGPRLVAAHLHVATTTVRRAERSTWAAIDVYGTEPAPGPDGGVNPLAATYLNRLSDFLFVLARYIGHRLGAPEVTWKGRG